MYGSALYFRHYVTASHSMALTCHHCHILWLYLVTSYDYLVTASQSSRHCFILWLYLVNITFYGSKLLIYLVLWLYLLSFVLWRYLVTISFYGFTLSLSYSMTLPFRVASFYGPILSLSHSMALYCLCLILWPYLVTVSQSSYCVSFYVMTLSCQWVSI